MKYITLKIVGGSKLGESSMQRPKTFNDVDIRLAAIKLGCDLLSSMRVYVSRGIDKALAHGTNPPRAFSRWAKEAEEIERLARRLLKSDLKGARLSVESMYKKVIVLLTKSPLKPTLITDRQSGLITITLAGDSILHLVESCGYGEKSFSIDVTHFGWKAASVVDLKVPVATEMPTIKADMKSEVKSRVAKEETGTRSSTESKSPAMEEILAPKGESIFRETDLKPPILETRDENTPTGTVSEVDSAKPDSMKRSTTEAEMRSKVISRALSEETGTSSHPGPVSEDILAPAEDTFGGKYLKYPILDKLDENTPNQTEMSSQMKPEMSTDSKVLILTSVKAGWDGSYDLQLETCYGDHFAKMHNSIKDSKREDLLLGPKQEDFLLYEIGGILKRNPLHEKWGQLNVLLLMAKEFPSIPEKPYCPNLGFLFLQNNRGLRAVPDSFFEDMPSLLVLDLSNTGIRSLPTSVFSLTKLQVLFLRDCHNLDQISPKIENLKEIELLDIWGTKVYNLPDEIASLERLRCLLVSFYEADEASEYADLPHNLISNGVLSKLRMLKTLSISVHPADSRWKNNSVNVVEDVSKLSKLAYLQFYFPENRSLELFVQSYSWETEVLKKFKFVVGRDIVRVGCRVPVNIKSEYNKFDRCLRFVNTDQILGAVGVLLERTTAFYVDHLYTIESLSKFGYTKFKELKFLIVRECPILMVIFKCDEKTDSIFPWLEHLSLHYLWKMEQIWQGPVSSGSFNKLKKLSVHMCPKLEYVLRWSMLHCVAHLEELVVEDCKSVKVIIEMDEERVGNSGILYNLSTVTLNLLPELVTFCDGIQPNRVQFNIYDCPNFSWGLV